MQTDIREKAENHLDWFPKMGLYETEYFISFYYIEIDAIGPVSYLDEDEDEDEDYDPDDDWEAEQRKQLKKVRQLNKRYSRRFRKNHGNNI